MKDILGKITYRRVINISFPVIVSSSSAPLLGLVDTGVIGQLEKVDLIAAIGLGTIIIF